MKQKKRKIFQNQKKEEKDEHLRKLVRDLDNQEKYHLYDHDDIDYYEIRDIENLFDKVNEEDCYKPLLVKSSFKGNYKYYESRGDKENKLSVRQYLSKITQHLYDLINDHKIAKKVWKI